MRELEVFMINMQAIPFLKNLIQKNWELIFACFTKCFIVHVAVILLLLNLVHTMKSTESIFLEQEFENCFAMELCHQRKSFDLNLRGLPCKGFSRKDSMKTRKLSRRLEKQSNRFFHFIKT